MPLFVVERQFAEKLDEITKEDADRIRAVNDEVGASWVVSFLSADRKKTYCLYEAPSAEAIREAARRAGLPADVITEISERVDPSALG